MIKPIVHEIDDLNLSNRSINALKRNGFFFINQLKGYTQETLMQLKGIGADCAKEILSKKVGV